jgi:hypothetical protein
VILAMVAMFWCGWMPTDNTLSTCSKGLVRCWVECGPLYNPLAQNLESLSVSLYLCMVVPELTISAMRRTVAFCSRSPWGSSGD